MVDISVRKWREYISGSTEKTTLEDTDKFAGVAAGPLTRHFTWSRIKAALDDRYLARTGGVVDKGAAGNTEVIINSAADEPRIILQAGGASQQLIRSTPVGDFEIYDYVNGAILAYDKSADEVTIPSLDSQYPRLAEPNTFTADGGAGDPFITAESAIPIMQVTQTAAAADSQRQQWLFQAGFWFVQFLTDAGAVKSTPLVVGDNYVTVPDATADAQALNRQTGDARYPLRAGAAEAVRNIAANLQTGWTASATYPRIWREGQRVYLHVLALDNGGSGDANALAIPTGYQPDINQPVMFAPSALGAGDVIHAQVAAIGGGVWMLQNLPAAPSATGVVSWRTLQAVPDPLPGVAT